MPVTSVCRCQQLSLAAVLGARQCLVSTAADAAVHPFTDVVAIHDEVTAVDHVAQARGRTLLVDLAPLESTLAKLPSMPESKIVSLIPLTTCADPDATRVTPLLSRLRRLEPRSPPLVLFLSRPTLVPPAPTPLPSFLNSSLFAPFV